MVPAFASSFSENLDLSSDLQHVDRTRNLATTNRSCSATYNGPSSRMQQQK